MGRLSGFKYRDVVQKLRAFGFVYDRQGPGSHEIWRQSQTGRKVTLPHHPGDVKEGGHKRVIPRSDRRIL